MPKPPALQPGEKTKTFMVKHGHMIADNDGIMRIGKGTLPAKDDVPGNDLIELSYEQAKYYRNLDKIEVPLEDFSDDADNKTNPDETSAGDEAERAGESAFGAPSSDPFAQAARGNSG